MMHWQHHTSHITCSSNVQRWDSKTQLIENGIYLGHIASLQFAGPWKMTKVQCVMQKALQLVI